VICHCPLKYVIHTNFVLLAVVQSQPVLSFLVVWYFSRISSWINVCTRILHDLQLPAVATQYGALKCEVSGTWIPTCWWCLMTDRLMFSLLFNLFIRNIFSSCFRRLWHTIWGVQNHSGPSRKFPKMTYMHTLSVLPEPFQCHSGPSPDSTSFARCHHYPENNNRTCPKPEWAIPQYFIYLLIWWLKMLFLHAKKGELSVIEHKLSCREYETFLFAILLLLRMSYHTLCHTLPFAIFNHFKQTTG